MARGIAGDIRLDPRVKAFLVGVPAPCRQVMGAMHALEVYTTVCPDISRDTARDLAAFCKG
jgi:hypothetical protein